MIRLTKEPVVRLADGSFVKAVSYGGSWQGARNHTMAWQILRGHRTSEDEKNLTLKFDCLVSPDDNSVSTLQEARAMHCSEFLLPWIFTNGHNPLACSGGTINNDDHVFGYDCVRKYGGIYVPPYTAIIHQYMREAVAAGGQLILAGDSHTRYGCLGAMGIGEGGIELAKQAIGGSYSVHRPQVLAVLLTGSLRPGVGAMDVALDLIRETFATGWNKNKILEFVGPGIHNLSMDARFGLDAMTTESACYSTIWETDEKVKEWFRVHQRPQDYRHLVPEGDAGYDGLIEIDLSKIEPMIALPFHPSNVFSVRSLTENQTFLEDALREVEENAEKLSGGLHYTLRDKVRDGRLTVQYATIGGCVGGMFENLYRAAEILGDYVIPHDGVPLGIYPASQPTLAEAMKQGVIGRLIQAGATLHPCMCGPCFGSTDVPANNSLSIRHVARNYYSREGSRPDQGQLSASAIMDARSIAATVRNGGRLTSALEWEPVEEPVSYGYDASYYEKAVYQGYGKPQPDVRLRLGPNIADWPEMPEMKEHMLLKVTGSYAGSITTDELCPSGEASSLRSNPDKIAEFTLRSRDRGYVERTKAFRDQRETDPEFRQIRKEFAERYGIREEEIGCGAVLVSEAVGDGSSREQAASNQKTLGGWANLAREYSTKRYRSNCIGWGLIPLQTEDRVLPEEGTYLFLPGVRKAILTGARELPACLPTVNRQLTLQIGEMTQEEREILVSGGMINYYRAGC
ncbi:MAG: hydratase [Clostridiales bacterium]|nr:hydratase [Clostridiales bacterium]